MGCFVPPRMEATHQWPLGAAACLLPSASADVRSSGDVIASCQAGADMEQGMYYGGGNVSVVNNQSQPLAYEFVSLGLKGRTDGFTLLGGDATASKSVNVLFYTENLLENIDIGGSLLGLHAAYADARGILMTSAQAKAGTFATMYDGPRPPPFNDTLDGSEGGAKGATMPLKLTPCVQGGASNQVRHNLFFRIALADEVLQYPPPTHARAPTHPAPVLDRGTGHPHHPCPFLRRSHSNE